MRQPPMSPLPVIAYGGGPASMRHPRQCQISFVFFSWMLLFMGLEKKSTISQDGNDV